MSSVHLGICVCVKVGGDDRLSRIDQKGQTSSGYIALPMIFLFSFLFFNIRCWLMQGGFMKGKELD